MAAKRKKRPKARTATKSPRAGRLWPSRATIADAHGGYEYTVNLAPVEDPEERFGRRMKLSHAIEREGIEVTGDGCGIGEGGGDLGCDIGVRTSRPDIEAVARRLATLAGLEVVSVVRAGTGKPTKALKGPHDCYGSDHKMGMAVPKGGSSCARCAFGHMEKDGPHCSNTCWVETPKAQGGGGGKTHLPVMDPSTYCCDMYAIVEKAKPRGKA